MVTMVTISTTSGAVTVTFSDNDHYLNNGTISFPLNSLILVTDESDMATFKNVAEDIVFSATYTELGMSKDDLIALYESSFVGSTGGGGGVTPEEVETMIDEAVSGKADTSALTAYATTQYVDSSVSGKADTNDVNEALEVATRALFEVRDDATQALTQLGGNSIVALTQAQYDALTTKDAHTLFIITE